MFVTPRVVGRLNFTTTTAGRAFVMPFSGRLTAVKISDTTAVTASDTNYHTFTVVNKGLANAGTTAMIATTTSKATGTGATGDIAANIPKDATLSTTYADTLFVEGDVVLVTATRASSGAFTNGAVTLIAVPGGY
jgi:hypothetical protein